MEWIIEFVLELILDGSMEVLGAKRAPVWIRALAGIVLLIVYGGLLTVGACLMISGIKHADWAQVAVGGVLTVLVIGFAVYLAKSRRKAK